jgi:hypothetical protein
LFLHLKEFLSDRILREKGIVQNWLKVLAATFLDDGVKKLTQSHAKCFNSRGDHVEI